MFEIISQRDAAPAHHRVASLGLVSPADGPPAQPDVCGVMGRGEGCCNYHLQTGGRRGVCEFEKRELIYILISGVTHTFHVNSGRDFVTALTFKRTSFHHTTHGYQTVRWHRQLCERFVLPRPAPRVATEQAALSGTGMPLFLRNVAAECT